MRRSQADQDNKTSSKKSKTSTEMARIISNEGERLLKWTSPHNRVAMKILI